MNDTPKSLTHCPHCGGALGDDGMAHRLQALRHERDLTLRDVAEGAAISVPTVSRAETGRPITTANLARLAKWYGVTTDWLLGLEADGKDGR